MNCDAIAPLYRVIEYLAFGGRLQRHRLHFLHAAEGRKNALVLGDGDGRFSKELIESYPGMTLDSIDLSPRMLELARERIEVGASSTPGVRLICGDALRQSFPQASYDLIATHFFLDCFTAAEVESLIEKLSRHAAPGTVWLITDFRKPAGFWRGLHAGLWLRVMYFFFRIFTKLEVRQLPEHRGILRKHGLHLLAEEASMGQLVCSELWQF